MSEKYRGNVNSMEGKTEMQASERGLDKVSVKKKLYSLFEAGVTPKNITHEQLAEVFGVAIPYTKQDKKRVVDTHKLAGRINAQIRKIFPTLNRKETIEFQYKLFLEQKAEQK